MAVREEVVSGSLPGPPAGVFGYRVMVAEPLAHEDFLRGLCDVEAPLGDRRAGVRVRIGRAVHVGDLLGAVVKGQRVGIARALVFVPGDAIFRAEQDGRIVRVDIAAQVRLDEAAPAAAHPEPVPRRQRVLRAGIRVVVRVEIQIDRQADLPEVVGAYQPLRAGPRPPQ